jgi:transposase
LQLSLFDQPHLLEITSPDFPGERLIACYNPWLAEERRRKREALLAATEAALERIAREVTRRTRTPLSAAEIGQKVGRVLHRYKMGKHFEREIAAGVFRYRRKPESIQREAALDGLYVVRTSEPAERLSADDAVRSYKNLAQVERIFRGLKGLELLIRPIRHREARRVRAHIFLCVLAYYVEWHMRQALAPLLFEDEQLSSDRRQRHPVAKATPSISAERKKVERTTAEGFPVHSFLTLLAALATRSRTRCRVKSDPAGPTFDQITPPTPLQERALQLLGLA